MSTKRAPKRSIKKVTTTTTDLPGEKAGRKLLKESRGAYHAKSGVTAETQINLAQLASEVAEIRRQLQAIEAQVSRLRADQLRVSADRITTAENLAWLKQAEPAFAFWDNAEDAIYDTL